MPPTPATPRALTLAAALAAAAWFATSTGCSSPPRTPSRPEPAHLSRFEFSRPQMGVPFRIVAYAASEAEAQAAAEAAHARVAELNAALSDYDPDSELSRVCRNTPPGQPAPVGPDLWFMLSRSADCSKRSHGAFDVTLGPVVNLWRRSRRRGELPPPHLLAEARARVGWQHLELNPRRRTVTFHRPDMRLDFGGIAKGYAADEALAVLRRHGIHRALVAAAGDVTVGDPPPGQPAWRVEIGTLDTTNAPPARIAWLRNASVSTSGDLYQRLEINGVRYSHIVDPHTGIGLTNHALVTVIAPDGTTADSLATTLSVLGPDQGLAFLRRSSRHAAALILQARGDHIESLETPNLQHWLTPSP